jgi:hypothetical protein
MIKKTQIPNQIVSDFNSSAILAPAILEVFAARANFPMVNKFDYGELLAPRRQERQVQNRFSFAAFASLRETFLLAVAV